MNRLFVCDSSYKRVSLLTFDIVCSIVVCFRRFLFVAACDQLKIRMTSIYSMKSCFSILILFIECDDTRHRVFSLLFSVIIRKLELLSFQFDDQSLINWLIFFVIIRSYKSKFVIVSSFLQFFHFFNFSLLTLLIFISFISSLTWLSHVFHEIRSLLFLLRMK
jgi:uncharacterized protein YsxB (DUF464 family)